MEVVVNDRQILNLSKRLNNSAKELENEIKQIKNITSNISTSWTGNDALKYIEIIEKKYILGLEELQEKIESYAKYLENVPGAYELLDEIYSNREMET